MKNVAVFCGSSDGSNEVYKTQAYKLGQYLAKQKIGLVYGGAKVGVMGAVANGVLDEKGKAIGVLPTFLGSKEIAHDELSELIMVDTMHERKKIMNDRCDGIIMLPGGIGTLEEFFEMFTWGQLGLHQKPIAILNVNHFYDDLLALTQKMVDQGFLKQMNQDMIICSDSIEELIIRMTEYKAPVVTKWITDKTL